MRSSRLLVAVLLATLIVTVARASAQPVPLTTLIAEQQVATWRCADQRGIPRPRPSVEPWALPRSHAYRKWVLTSWKKKRHACIVALHEQTKRTIPDSHDWLSSIRWVQKIYPGTYDWLYWISDREGGHGAWVWYGGGHWRGYHVGGDNVTGDDTVGGNLQFRYSTFVPYWRAAYADLRKRGYIVPDFKMPPEGGNPKYAAWLSPMGQALTGAYMRYTGRTGHHWG